jgi:outer membrane murein-binding lipoprotein Lpp
MDIDDQTKYQDQETDKVREINQGLKAKVNALKEDVNLLSEEVNAL